jgi:hypothetical protein
MKSFLRNLFLPVAGLALAATAATAATWPPAPGDLILAVQATGGTGSTTNVFFNLGPAHTLRDNPSPAGTLVNLDAELTAAFGAGWSSRSDLYFGVIANRSNATPSGIGSAAPENGDPARTIYASKGVATAGAGTPWSGFSVSALGIAATAHQGQIAAIDNIAANANNVMTLTQAANPVEWNNSWSQWNPTPGAGFSIFAGGIQAKINATAALVDVFRVLSTTGNSSYVTTVSLAANGDVTAARAGAASQYYTITLKTANGSVSGGGLDILHAAGSIAKLTASPASGYGFDTWIGTPRGTGSPNPLSLVMDKNKTITAKFGALPAVASPTFKSVTETTAILGANVTSLGGGRAQERGILFADETVNGNPLLNGTGVTKVLKTGGRGVFTIPVTALEGGKTYAFKGFIKTNIGTSYSEVSYFTTDTNVSFTGGIGTVTGRPIRAGKTQVFAINLAKSTIAAFDSLGASGSQAWELLKSSLDARGKVLWTVIGSGTGNVAFANPLTNGTYSLRLTNNGTSTDNVDLVLDGSNYADPRPDISGGYTAAAAGAFGADVYDPTAQTVEQSTREAKYRDYYFLLGNDGSVPDAMKVSATIGGRPDLFRTMYKVGIKNVTVGIRLGKYATPVLSSTDAPVLLFCRVSPNRSDSRIAQKVLNNKGRLVTQYGAETFNGIVRIAPATDPTITDTVDVILNALAN